MQYRSPRPSRYSLALLFLSSLVASAQTATPTLSVNAGTGRYAINPNVYGIANGVNATFAAQIGLPNVRWGGDGATRYNWQVDSSNAGFDWYFMGGNGQTSPVPSASADAMVNSYKPAGALITIPIIPYVNSSAAWSCSFPVSVYGAQQSTNPYVHPNGDNCGNSIAANGAQLTDTNIYANHINNTVGLQQGWLQHLVGAFGTAATGGVPFYQLDNEPYGWGNTHRDVEPNGATYPTITQLGQQYAAIIKQVDPTAKVLGPSDFTLGGWIGNPSQQNNLYAAQYYLQQMQAYQTAHGVRILDYLDEHYYPQFTDATSQLASTRTLWDPTFNGGTWVEQWYFDGPMQLIPRMQGWVAQYYPGTGVSLSEYSIDSGNKLITDALAEMDLLGIFGRGQLALANMWNPPAPTDPIAYAFRMFRNYDGNGSYYGDTWVNATSSDATQSQLSVYAAQRTVDNVLTVLVLNKTTAAINTTLQLAGLNLPSTAAVYTYSGANLNQIVNSAAGISSGVISYNFPAYSATLFAITPAVAPPPTGPVEVSLASVANTHGIYTNGTSFTTGGLDGGSYAYSEQLLGTALTYAGIPYALGAANGADVVKGKSAPVISLPAGAFSTLHLLGTAVNGNQPSQHFIVTYTDGSTSTFTQGLSDWHTPQGYSGEAVAQTDAYRDTSSAGTQALQFDVYGYSFNLNTSKTAKSLTLPNNGNVAVLAVTLK